MDHLQQLIDRYPSLKPIKQDIQGAFNIMAESFLKGGKLLIAGNGGSAADAEHIVGELIKSFIIKRKLPDSFIENISRINPDVALYLVPRLQPGLPAIALSNHS